MGLTNVIGPCCDSKWWTIFHANYNFDTSRYRQWYAWIAFIEYDATDLIFDFIVLLLVSLQRCNFIAYDHADKDNEIMQQQLTLTKQMKIRKDGDETADILYDSIKLQILIYSDKVLLLLMFIFGIMNVDLLSIIFLLFPFFELFFSH